MSSFSGNLILVLLGLLNGLAIGFIIGFRGGFSCAITLIDKLERDNQKKNWQNETFQ